VANRAQVTRAIRSMNGRASAERRRLVGWPGGVFAALDDAAAAGCGLEARGPAAWKAALRLR
jgi:hypothetical protein